MILFLKKITIYFITLLILSYIAYYIDWKILIKTGEKASLWFLISGMACFIFYPLIVGFRWQKILYYHSYFCSTKECIYAALHSFSANLIAPAHSGDFIKALSMKSIQEKSQLITIILCERLADLIILSSIIFITNIYFVKIWESLFGLVMLFVILFFVIISKYFYIKINNEKIIKLQNIILNALLSWRTMPNKMLKVAMYTLLNWMIGTFQIWCFFNSLNIEISYLITLSIFPLTVLISIIPITPAGIGVREGAFIILFSNYASPEICVFVSVLYFLSSTAVNSIMGSFFIKTLFAEKS